MSLRKTLLIALVLTTVTAMQGCALMVGAAAGGAAGYALRDHGYDVRSPITKEHH